MHIDVFSSKYKHVFFLFFIKQKGQYVKKERKKEK